MRFFTPFFIKLFNFVTKDMPGIFREVICIEILKNWLPAVSDSGESKIEPYTAHIVFWQYFDPFNSSSVKILYIVDFQTIHAKTHWYMYYQSFWKNFR
jgi:hypothetical protein